MKKGANRINMYEMCTLFIVRHSKNLLSYMVFMEHRAGYSINLEIFFGDFAGKFNMILN